MRTILILILVTVFSCTGNRKTVITTQETTHTEGYKSLKKLRYDTLNYVKENFENRKAKYIGQKMEYLLNELEVPIIDVFYKGGNRKDIIIEVLFYLYDNKMAYYNGHRTKIYIRLAEPLNKQEFIEKRKGSHDEWSEKDFELIKDSKIADITVVDFE